MWPSTAIRRPSPAIHRAVRSAAAIDSGFALYASCHHVHPGVVHEGLHPPRRRRSPRERRGARLGSGTPSSRPTAAAASAFGTMCSPGTASRTRSRSPRDEVERASPSVSRRDVLSAHVRRRRARPNVTTRRASIGPAYPATTGSSALRTATPSGAERVDGLRGGLDDARPTSRRSPCARRRRW